MAASWWWWLPLPAWLGSGALWFVVLNAVIAAVAFLSSRAGPHPLPSPRRAAGVTRRASSAVLQRLRSSSIFSFPSACLTFLQPDAATVTAAAPQERQEEPVKTASPTKPSPSLSQSPPRTRAMPTPPPPPTTTTPPAAPTPAAEEDGGDDEGPDAMSMDEAYALAVAARRRPEREREEEARRSEVDARAEEFIRGFKDDLRQQRLNSIFNYTQMLKRRALGGGRRQPEAARPDQQ